MLQADDVRAAQAGDKEAFARLVQQHQSVVCAIALGVTRNVSLSEEVAQEAFLQAWLGLPKLRDVSRFAPWLNKLTRHQALFARRTSQRRQTRFVRDETVLASAGAEAPSPADLVESADDAAVVNEVLGALPEQTRELVVLYYREDISLARAAALLGLKEEAAKKRLARAREHLKESLLTRFGDAAKKTAPAASFVAVLYSRLPEAHAAPTTLTALASTKVAGGLVLSACIVSLGWVGIGSSSVVVADAQPVEEEVSTPMPMQETAPATPKSRKEAHRPAPRASATAPASAPAFSSAPTSADAAPSPTLQPTLDKKDVFGEVKRHFPEMRQCVADYIKGGGHAPLPERLLIKWVILPTGHTAAAQLANHELSGTALEACALASVATWQFPAFERGDIPVAFSFPVFLPPDYQAIPVDEETLRFRRLMSALLARGLRDGHDTDSRLKPVTMSLRNVELEEVAQVLAHISGVAIRVAAELKHTKVLLDVERVSPLMAIETLLKVNGLEAHVGEDGVLITR